MTASLAIRVADASELAAARPRLGEILRDCVERGAVVHFLAPLAPAEAEGFWQKVEQAAAEDRCRVLLAEAAGTVMGTVQLELETPPNQPHRAGVAKLLVHSAARRRGVGEALMRELELVAEREGRRLLTLDCVTDGDAERLYRRLGWTLAGVIPRYAFDPHGALTDASFYWKQIAAAELQRPRPRPVITRPR